MFNEEQARKLFATRWWASDDIQNSSEKWKRLAVFQLSQNVLCMPYAVYHAAVENVIGEGLRPEKITSIRYDILLKLTGRKYVQTDADCLQLLPASAREEFLK